MKKILIASALALCATAAFALEIQKVPTTGAHPFKVREAKAKVALNPATYTIITSTPDGEMLPDLSWTSDGCYPNGTGGVAWIQVSGYAAQIIVNGNRMYMYAPITQLADISAAWIEGTISEDGKTVRFPTPQAYMLNGFDVLYATRCNADGTPDPKNLDLVFSYDNTGLTQTDGGVLLLTDLQGNFYGYGEKSISIGKINDAKASLPEGVTPQSYKLEFKKGDNANRQTALIAFDGDDVYFSDPLGVENSWFKGIRNGNTITVATPQYMGSGSGFPMYVTTGTEVRTTQMDQLTGQPYEVIDYKVTPNADIIFTVDEATGKISSTQLLLMNSAKEQRGTAYAPLMKPAYTPWEAEAAVPATPWVDYYFDLNDYIEYGLKGCMVSFEVPSTGTDGEFIPQENIYYQISFDGKPLEFYGTSYIPYYGQFNNAETQEVIQLSSDNYDSHSLQVPYNPKKTISLQSFYDFNGDLIESEVVEYEIVNGELVDAGVGSACAGTLPESVRYYDLNGIEIVNPAHNSGIMVRVTTFVDGSRKTEKILK